MNPRRSALLLLCLSIVVLQFGCPPGSVPGLPTGGGGTSFDTAALVSLSSAGKASIAGTITQGRVEFYDLGPCAVGDRIQLTVEAAAGSNLDPLAALFNAAGELYAMNDDFDLDTNRLESVIDQVVRTASDHFYLAVTQSSFGNTTGGYSGEITLTRGGTVTPPDVQYLVLDFAGGSVSIPNVGNYNLTAFNASDIDSAYNGQTAAIKAQIVATVRENFQGFGMQIVTSDDPPPQSNCVSTLYFGAFSQSAFGMAESVDHDNANYCDDAIIFTDNFSDPFSSLPSVQGIGIAIGNVAAHEAGHLLGLEHTTDITDLMDTTGSASTLLADQEFKTANLHSSIFPIGKQNGILLLNEVIP